MQENLRHPSAIRKFLLVTLTLFVSANVQAISPEDLASRIIERINEKDSRSILQEFYNWNAIYAEQRKNDSTASNESPASYRKRMLNNSSSGQAPLPAEVQEALNDPKKRRVPLYALPVPINPEALRQQTETLKRAEFYLKEVNINGKTATVKVRQVLDKQASNATLYLRYIEDNWYLDHKLPTNLGVFTTNP